MKQFLLCSGLFSELLILKTLFMPANICLKATYCETLKKHDRIHTFHKKILDLNIMNFNEVCDSSKENYFTQIRTKGHLSSNNKKSFVPSLLQELIEIIVFVLRN